MLAARITRTVALVAALVLGGQAAAGAPARSGAGSPPGGGRYVVQPGDTLSGVAARLGVSVSGLAAANGIADRDRIRDGQVIVVAGLGPAGNPSSPGVSEEAYTVRPGDNLEGIAAHNGTSVAGLARLNGIADPNLVVDGSRLRIPSVADSAGGATGARPPRLRANPARAQLESRFDHWASTYGVPADLLKAMTWYESGWQNHVVSATGARGIGQLMPDTVSFVNATLLRARLDPSDPDNNIAMSARFLRFLLDQTGGRADTALAAYYQGLASVRSGRLYADTQRYVAGVLAARAQFG